MVVDINNIFFLNIKTGMSTQARVPTKINVIVIINNVELKNQLIYNMDFPTVLVTRV